MRKGADAPDRFSCASSMNLAPGAILKHTPLHELHAELGARFGPFAGYDMPLFYKPGIISEHGHVRKSAGLFDISHMMQLELSGAGSAALLSRLCPYVAADQETGRARYTFFLNEQGGVMDDLIVTRLAQDRFLVVCNAANAARDHEHVLHYAPGFEVEVAVRDRAFLALQGPLAAAVMEDAGIRCGDFYFLDAREMAIDGGDWFISRSGYTGEDGFEIALPAGEAERFARRLLADDRVLPIGLGARDSLRLEAGLPLHGQDLAEDINPLEAGLAWAIPAPLRREGAYGGALAIAQKAALGRARMRSGLTPEGSAPVRAHAPVFDASGRQVGEVTSGGFGPSFGGPIAMALVEASAEEPFSCELRGKRIPAARQKLPFIPHRYRTRTTA